MEGSVLEEERHHGVCTPIPNSSKSLINIDSISIDLVNGNENNEMGDCKHFSIRGYVAEIRKKDRKICWPFAIDDKHNNPEEHICTLPPLQAAKFRWWRCQNCLREIDPQGTANEIKTVPNCCNDGVKSNRYCSHLSSQNKAAILPSDFQQALMLVSLGGRGADANTYANVKSKDHGVPSCTDKREKEAEIAYTTGHEISSKDDVNQDFSRPSSDATKFNPWLKLERHTGDKAALESKCNRFVKTCKLKCGINEAAVCGISGVAGVVNETVFAANGHASEHPSQEFDTHDCASSESDEILGVNNGLNQHHGDSSSFYRQKPQKVRLLAELLVANADNIPADDAPSSGSAGVDSLSVSQDQAAIQGNLERGFKGQTRKRRMPHDGDWRSPVTSSPKSETKKSRMFKEDVENTAIALAGSNSNKFASAGTSSQAGRKHQWKKHGVGRNPLLNKKIKMTQDDDRCPPLLPLQDVVPRENEKKIQDAYKSNTADTASTHQFSTGREIDPLLRSFFPAQRTERKSSLCKKKNKMPQAEDFQAFLKYWNNDLLREQSMTKQNVETMQTGPKVVQIQTLHDAPAGKRPYFSYENYLDAPKNNRNCIAHIEGQSDFLLPWQEGIFREDYVTRKNVGNKYVGESSVSNKSAADAFIDKEVRWDLSIKTGPGEPSLVSENRNRPLRVEVGDLSTLQKMDVSSKSNGEKAIRTRENSEFIKKQGGQRADKVFEQGAIDDIPMEIVELLAKNQYERRLHDAEKVTSFLETTNKARNVERIDVNNVRADGEQKLLHKKNPHSRKSLSSNARNNMFMIGKTVGSTIQKSVSNFPHMGLQEESSTSIGFQAFSQNQQKFSSGVQFPVSGSSRHGVAQNCKDGNMQGGMSFPTSLQSFKAYDPCLTSPQHKIIQNHNVQAPPNKGIEFYPQLRGSVDMYSNETIPAMHLLSLMDPAMRSTTPMSVDENAKFLERPSFPQGHQSKEFSGLDIGICNTSHASRHISSVDYRKNLLSEKSCECYSAVPAFGALTSSLQNDTSIRRATDFLRQTPVKSREKGKEKIPYSPTRRRVSKSQKYASTNVGFGTSCEFSPVQSTDKRFPGASDLIVHPSKCRTMTDSMKHVESEPQSSHGTVWPAKRSPETEICSVNRNPADFSMPVAGNMYMIGAEDLKVRKRICSGDRFTLSNVNRQKKQRLTKLTAAKERGRNKIP